MVSVESRSRPHRDVVDPQQRRAAVREPEQALEGDARGRARRGRTAGAGENASTPDSSPCAQRQPGGGVGADDDVRAPAGRAHAHARAERRAADLPRVPDVPQAHVVGGVEALLRAQVAARKGAERLLDLRRERRQGRHDIRRASGRGADSALIVTAPCARSASTTPGRAASGRSSRAIPARSASTPAGRPSTPASTSATPALRRLLPAQALPRARGLRRDVRGEYHGHQRQDLRRRAGGGPLPRRSWRAR